MTATADTSGQAANTPWHLWMLGAISMLWNGFGGFDYTMSHLRGEAYYRLMGMSDAQIAYLNAMPTWMHAAWALGVWGSVAGSILLLLRSKWAFHAFAVSFLGVIGNLLYSFVLSPGAEANGAGGAAFTLVIAAICLFLLWYSWLMTKRGVLR
jgi:hypothetical protein